MKRYQKILYDAVTTSLDNKSDIYKVSSTLPTGVGTYVLLKKITTSQSIIGNYKITNDGSYTQYNSFKIVYDNVGNQFVFFPGQDLVDGSSEINNQIITMYPYISTLDALNLKLSVANNGGTVCSIEFSYFII